MDAGGSRTQMAMRSATTIVSAMAVAALGLVFAISFVALIYTGPLSYFLGSAITLTLMGTAIMVVVGAWLHRLPALSSPQDATALLLASGVASAAAADPGGINGPTVAALIAVITAITGAVIYVAGKLRVGYLARYIPYPVLGGFLAATGYLLTTGAIGLLLDRSVGFSDLLGLFESTVFLRWFPWLLLSAAIVVVTRIFRNELTLPLCVLFVASGFYAWLYATGTSMEQAADRGWLLGPFQVPENEATSVSVLIAQVDLGAIGANLYLVFGVIALTMIGALLNMSGLEIALKQRTDLNADLRAVGVANLAASASGGLVGWPLIGESLLAARLKLPILVSSIAVAAACILGIVLGGDVLELLPRGLFAALVGFLGIDLLVQWLWAERRSFPAHDFAVLILILLTAMTVGFLPAIAVGFAAAAVLFVVSYSRLDPVFARSSLAARRSTFERSVMDDDRLTIEGDGVIVYELTGFIFFGSTHRLSERVREDIASNGMTELILDFSRVTGVDVSTIRGIVHMIDLCAVENVRLTLSGMESDTAALVSRQAENVPSVIPTLEEAVQGAEDRLLAAPSGIDAPRHSIDIDELLGGLTPTLSLSPGETLFAEGSTSRTLFILCSGIARAEVATNGPEPLVVRRHVTGSMIGEIAFCTGIPRTASVVAETACELAVIELDDLGGLPVDRAEFYALIAARLGDRLARSTRLLQQISH